MKTKLVGPDPKNTERLVNHDGCGEWSMGLWLESVAALLGPEDGRLARPTNIFGQTWQTRLVSDQMERILEEVLFAESTSPAFCAPWRLSPILIVTRAARGRLPTRSYVLDWTVVAMGSDRGAE